MKLDVIHAILADTVTCVVKMREVIEVSELTARQFIEQSKQSKLDQSTAAKLNFKLEMTIYCENHEEYGPRIMSLHEEEAGGIKYFKCDKCDNKVSLMIQTV